MYVLALLCLAGSVQAQDKDAILVEVGDDRVSVAQFERIYNKNNHITEAIEKKTPEEYLDLFINFKLKVQEAESRGMDTATAFQDELQSYTSVLAQPYLVDGSYNERLLEEAYERMLEDVAASHIMVQVDKDASPADTLKAYNKALSIRARLKDGQEFESVAREMSEDPSVKDNGGYLGYFSAFRMVYPFESAAYNLQVGEVSMPVRSDYGYHIIRLDNRRPAMGTVTAAHIMIVSKAGDSDEDKAKAEKKIREIYGLLEDGQQFEKLASVYSQDPGSASQGGRLPEFGAGKMVPAFEEQVVKLEDNQYSEPFQTRFGWHIVKLVNKKTVGSFDEEKPNLERLIARDGRGQGSEKSLVRSLMKEYKVKLNTKAKASFVDVLDSTLYEGRWEASKASGLSGKMITIRDKQYGKETVVYDAEDFAKYIEQKQRLYGKVDFTLFVDRIFDDYVTDRILGYEQSILKVKYPEYGDLIEEYHDGILLFELMDEVVWTKAVEDSTGLESFFQEHRDDYQWGERVVASIFVSTDSAAAVQVQQYLEEGLSADSITSLMNQKSELGVSVKSGTFEKGKNDIVDRVEWTEGVHSVLAVGSNYAVVNIDEVKPAGNKELNECRGAVTSAYQNFLEEKWVEQLHEKFTVIVHEEQLQYVSKQ